MLSILDPLRELTLLSIALRLLIAALCGGLIGVERGRKRHAAGLRTHAVVCVGAACVMMVNQYITLMFQPDGDPARMGAQVISGIGFLGNTILSKPCIIGTLRQVSFRKCVLCLWHQKE